MPINSSHEFSVEEIAQIEAAGLTIAEVRKFLSDFSVNAEGAAELEFDTAVAGALKAKADGTLILESYLDNEVSDEEARPQDETPLEGSIEKQPEDSTPTM